MQAIILTYKKNFFNMKCPLCNKSLLWSNDFDYEDFGHESDGIVGIYTCNNNECDVEDIHIYTPFNNELNDE